MDSDELIDQIMSWLARADPNAVIGVLLTLPDVGWIELREMADRGDLVLLKYRAQEPGGADIELICSRAAIRAARCLTRDG